MFRSVSFFSQRARAAGLALSIFLLGPSLSLFAETPPAAPDSTPGVTAEDIQARLERAQASTTLDDTTKAKIADFYAKAQEQFKVGQDWAAKAAQFEQQRAEAPDKIKEIEDFLAQPREEPSFDLPEDATPRACQPEKGRGPDKPDRGHHGTGGFGEGTGAAYGTAPEDPRTGCGRHQTPRSGQITAGSGARGK